MNPLFPMANVSKRATFLYLSHLCGSRTVLPHRRVCFVGGIIPHFFGERALVHICIPQTYTPCGRKSLSGWSYLVTLRPRSSRCLPSFCIYYTTLSWVCQGVFQNFFEFFEEFLRQIMLSRASLRHSPLDTIIIPHCGVFVKRFLKSFSTFLLCSARICSARWLPS